MPGRRAGVGRGGPAAGCRGRAALKPGAGLGAETPDPEGGPGPRPARARRLGVFLGPRLAVGAPRLGPLEGSGSPLAVLRMILESLRIPLPRPCPWGVGSLRVRLTPVGHNAGALPGSSRLTLTSSQGWALWYPSLQARKLRPREVESPAQGHSAVRSRAGTRIPGLSGP